MTAQIHENLILNGERTTMASCPTVPSDHPLILATTSWDHDDDESHRILCSTACWRRYRGTWEIKDGRRVARAARKGRTDRSNVMELAASRYAGWLETLAAPMARCFKRSVGIATRSNRGSNWSCVVETRSRNRQGNKSGRAPSSSKSLARIPSNHGIEIDNGST